MKKNYLYLSIGGGILVIIFIIFAFLSKSSAKPATPSSNSLSQPSSTSDTTSSSQQNNPLTVEPSVGYLPPENVAIQFYTWYASANNPLTSGAYKTNPYISTTYKKILEGFTRSKSNKNTDPVFCYQNRTKTVSASEAVYNPTGNKATVYLQKNDGFTIVKLYQVILVKTTNNLWVVDDSICIPKQNNQ